MDTGRQSAGIHSIRHPSLSGLYLISISLSLKLVGEYVAELTGYFF